jgi:hypothetical protein
MIAPRSSIQDDLPKNIIKSMRFILIIFYLRVNVFKLEAKMKRLCMLLLIWTGTVLATYGQSITVTLPNGGQDWKIGARCTIVWEASGISSGQYKIVLLKNNAPFATIANNISHRRSMYSWKVGEFTAHPEIELNPGTDYKIKVKLQDAPVADISDSDFTISRLDNVPRSRRGRKVPPPPPGIRITSPASGEVAYVGEDCLIRWVTPEGAE